VLVLVVLLFVLVALFVLVGVNRRVFAAERLHRNRSGTSFASRLENLHV